MDRGAAGVLVTAVVEVLLALVEEGGGEEAVGLDEGATVVWDTLVTLVLLDVSLVAILDIFNWYQRRHRGIVCSTKVSRNVSFILVLTVTKSTPMLSESKIFYR